MKNEQLLRLLGEVDERFIEESMMIERRPYQRLKWGGRTGTRHRCGIHALHIEYLE